MVFVILSSQVKSSHRYLYSDFINTDCVKAALQYQIGRQCVGNAK